MEPTGSPVKAYPGESIGVPGDSFSLSVTLVSTAHSASRENRMDIRKNADHAILCLVYVRRAAYQFGDGFPGTKTSYTYDSKNRMNTGVTIGQRQRCSKAPPTPTTAWTG